MKPVFLKKEEEILFLVEGKESNLNSCTCQGFSILDSRASLRGRYRAEILSTLPTMPVTDRIMDVVDFIIRKKADSYFGGKEREEE